MSSSFVWGVASPTVHCGVDHGRLFGEGVQEDARLRDAALGHEERRERGVPLGLGVHEGEEADEGLDGAGDGVRLCVKYDVPLQDLRGFCHAAVFVFVFVFGVRSSMSTIAKSAVARGSAWLKN